jgi:outer membrane protein OmpA-like peptidoglycan-associated protein
MRQARITVKLEYRMIKEWKYATVISAVTVLLAGCMPTQTPKPTVAVVKDQPQGNQLYNSSFEVAPNESKVFSWDYYKSTATVNTDPSIAKTGKRYLMASENKEHSLTRQTFFLEERGINARDIDNGLYLAKFGGYQAGEEGRADTGDIVLSFFDASDKFITQYKIGELNPGRQWVYREKIVQIPPKARVAQYNFTTQNTTGKRNPNKLDDAFLFIAKDFPSFLGKRYSNGRGGHIILPLGDLSFADRAVSFDKKLPANNGNSNPQMALGVPDEKTLSLSCGGSAVFEFTDNILMDFDGPDLYIFEHGPDVEPTAVAISKDGKKWLDVGKVGGGQASIDIKPFVSEGDSFSYVKLTDLKSACRSSYPGADIDAVAAIGAGIKKELASEILFDSGQYTLKPKAGTAIHNALKDIPNLGSMQLLVLGHTDSVGSTDTNQILSEKRADSVRDYLIQKENVSTDDIKTKGLGEQQPVATNETPKGRQKNRRVEIVFSPKGMTVSKAATPTKVETVKTSSAHTTSVTVMACPDLSKIYYSDKNKVVVKAEETMKTLLEKEFPEAKTVRSFMLNNDVVYVTYDTDAASHLHIYEVNKGLAFKTKKPRTYESFWVSGSEFLPANHFIVNYGTTGGMASEIVDLTSGKVVQTFSSIENTPDIKIPNKQLSPNKVFAFNDGQLRIVDKSKSRMNAGFCRDAEGYILDKKSLKILKKVSLLEPAHGPNKHSVLAAYFGAVNKKGEPVFYAISAQGPKIDRAIQSYISKDLADLIFYKAVNDPSTKLDYHGINLKTMQTEKFDKSHQGDYFIKRFTIDAKKVDELTDYGLPRIQDRYAVKDTRGGTLTIKDLAENQVYELPLGKANIATPVINGVGFIQKTSRQSDGGQTSNLSLLKFNAQGKAFLHNLMTTSGYTKTYVTPDKKHAIFFISNANDPKIREAKKAKQRKQYNGPIPYQYGAMVIDLETLEKVQRYKLENFSNESSCDVAGVSNNKFMVRNKEQWEIISFNP